MFDKKSYDRAYRLAHQTEILEYQRQWYHKNKDKHKGYCLKGKFGISLDDYNRMFAAQHGKCAICKSTDAKGHHKSFRLAVDHDHETKKVRGLLCSACNRLLGRIENEKGQAAIKYLLEAK